MNVLAGILGVLWLIALATLTGFFLWRWEARDLNRWDRERRIERERNAAIQRAIQHPCALRGHKHRLTVGGWLCLVCGDLVLTDDEDGVA